MLTDTGRTVTMRGKPLNLIGSEPKIGQPAPDFSVVNNDMKPVKLSDYRGKVVIVSSVPSLDTPVCNRETHRFNEEVGKLGDGVVVLTISMDLPFAQKRWCGAEGVKNVTTLSDYRDASFGNTYGVLIKELRLLARAVFVVDAQGVLRYTQLVNEVSSEPNYDEVIDSAKKLKGP